MHIIGMILTNKQWDSLVRPQLTDESYQELPGRRNYCGDLVLTFRRENGTTVQFWDGYKTKEKMKEFEKQTKGEILTIWGNENTHSMIPECRKFLTVRQIQGKKYQRSYNKEYSEKARRILLNASIFFMTCGGLSLLRIAWVNRKK